MAALFLKNAASSIIELVPDSLEPKGPLHASERLAPERLAPRGLSPGELDPGAPAADPSSPLVLIPLTAEDVARRSRRVKLTWFLTILAIAGVSGWFYKRSTDPIRAQRAYEAAQRLFNLAHYDQTIVSCDLAVALKPDFAAAYLLRGRARVAAYDPDRAIADFTKAAELQASDPQALLERAAAYVDGKKYADAIADTTAALAIDSHLARAYNLRGTAFRASGDPQKAVAEFSRALEIEPNSDNYYQRGATYQVLSDHRHAVEDFTQAIEWDPDKPQTYFARAESERMLGQTAQADKDHLRGRVLDGR
jgi:tetratricopeptide (TPR) repeat protein